MKVTKDGNNQEDQAAAAEPDKLDVPFGSNEIRLTGRQLLAAAAITVLILILLPKVWQVAEPFDPGADYRVPNALSNDYYLYRRLVDEAMDNGQLLVIGDSVIWGEYVSPDQTLTHFFNELDGGQRGALRFVNAGVNASHPLALEGIVRYHAKRIVDAPVIVHLNLLWMSSPERDLQVDKEMIFNHPRLAPQFRWRIPSYRASASERMSAVLDRYLPYRLWVDHLRIAGFDSLDLHSWTVEHPDENPLTRISTQLPLPSYELRHEPIPWDESGIVRQSMDWVELEESLQWGAFQRTVELLEKRGNRVLVIVGPLNEHMLTDQSREQYRSNILHAEQYLQDQEIPFLSPRLLPSEEFADASHPLSAGYRRLAQEIFEDPVFRRWLDER